MQTAVELLRQDLDAEIKLGTKMVVNWDAYLEMERVQMQQSFQDGQWDVAKHAYDQQVKQEIEKL